MAEFREGTRALLGDLEVRIYKGAEAFRGVEVVDVLRHIDEYVAKVDDFKKVGMEPPRRSPYADRHPENTAQAWKDLQDIAKNLEGHTVHEYLSAHIVFLDAAGYTLRKIRAGAHEYFKSPEMRAAFNAAAQGVRDAIPHIGAQEWEPLSTT